MLELGNTRIPRAIQYALNGVAMDAVKLSAPMLLETLDNPTPWIERAFVARRGDLKIADKNDAEASLVVKPDQSVVFKYMLGESENQKVKREAADVGPADKYTLVPLWPGIGMRTKVKKNAKGNLPKTALASLFAGKGTPNGVFWGTPVVLGEQRDLGLWSRPKRKWDSSQQQMVNQGPADDAPGGNGRNRAQPGADGPNPQVGCQGHGGAPLRRPGEVPVVLAMYPGNPTLRRAPNAARIACRSACRIRNRRTVRAALDISPIPWRRQPWPSPASAR